MASSDEKNFGQAKQSFADSQSKPVSYTAAQGVSQGGTFSSTIYRMFFPPSRTWADCPALIQDVWASLDHAEHKVQEAVPRPIPNTFLNSMRHALTDPSGKTESSLVYNSKLYTLQTEKQVEPNGTVRLSGTLQEHGMAQKTSFRLWYEKNSPNYVPTPIEYRAKPFLKLTFEAEPKELN